MTRFFTEVNQYSKSTLKTQMSILIAKYVFIISLLFQYSKQIIFLTGLLFSIIPK